jgi:serine/threonine protein kinase
MAQETADGVDVELVARAELRVGTVLKGKYHVDSVLGIGGMAVVYVVTHRNQKRFALKILHPELSIRADIKQRFLREGYAANSLNHPGAVAIMDDDVADDGAAFLVMELLEGSSIESLAEKVPRMAPDAVLAIAYQTLDTLTAAHSKGIVHRDIKPANLFLQPDGTLKVLDFGIARVKDATVGGRATSTGTMLGTPAYMAPEQAMGASSEVDGLSDVWAVGATMFTLLSHRLVHEADNATQLMIKAATQAPRSLATVRPELHPALFELVDRALAFEKSDRWSSASAMRDAVAQVHALLCGGPVSKAALASLIDEHVTSLKHIVAHAETVSADISPAASTGFASQPSRPRVSASGVSLPPASAKTTGQPVSSSHAGPGVPTSRRSSTRRIWPRNASIALGLVVLGTAAMVLVRPRLFPATGTGAASAFASTSSLLTVPSAAASSSTEPLSVLAPKAVLLAVSPVTASVEVDGQSAPVRGGFVEVRGTPGTMHIVQIMVGKRHENFPVLLLDGGTVPPKVELSESSAAVGQPRGKAQPQISAAPSPPPPPGNVSRTME